MKRFALVLMLVAGVAGAAIVTTPRADAGLFGGHKAAPTPSPSPSALPTASPEPPSVAIPRLQAKLKANPNDQHAMAELAGQFIGINRPDLSVQLTQRLLQMGDKSAQVYYLDGFAMEQLGRTDAAIADLEQARNLDPSNPGVLGQLVELYLRANRFTDAENIAKKNMILNKGTAQSILTLGSVYAAEQKFDRARALFQKAYAMDPKDTGPLYQIATTYAQQNNIPVALQYVAKILAIDPKDVQALVFKADLYGRQHDDQRTAAAYDDAIVAATSDGQRQAIIIRKAGYFAAEHKDAQAQAVFNKAIAQYPTSADMHIAFGDYWMAQKNINNAQAQWQAALTIDKNNAEALQRLGQTLLAQGKASQSVGYLEHLTQVAPDPQAFAMLGQAYTFLHDYGKSKDACAKSFSLQKNPSTLACVAGADFEMKNYKEATQIFDALDKGARGFLDQNPDLLWVAGQSYAHLHQNGKAIAAYKRLLPLIRKGTKQYSEVQKQIAMLSHPRGKH